MEERAINCIRREIRGGDCECGYGQQDRGRASVCTCMGLILTIIKEKTMYCIVECRYKREIERAIIKTNNDYDVMSNLVTMKRQRENVQIEIVHR